MPTHRPRHRQGQGSRGAVLIYLAVSLVALMGMAALTIDMGRLLVAKQRAQETVDAAALAGARYLTGDASSVGVNAATGTPALGDGPAAKAAKYAAMANNEASPGLSTLTLGGQPGVGVSFPQTGTIVDDNGATVPVRLGQSIRTEAILPVPMTFARLLGLQLTNVHAQSTVVLIDKAPPPQSIVANPLPWAIADTTIWDKSVNPPTLRVRMGDQITLKVTNPKDEENFIGSGNFLAVSYPGDHGASDYRARIAGTADPVTLTLDGETTLYSKPGNMTGPTEQGLTARLSGDPYPYPSANDTAWNSWLSSYDPQTGQRIATMRLGLVPIVLDPGGSLHGRSELELIGFAGVFIEGFETVGNGNKAYTRLTARITQGFYRMQDITWVGPGGSPGYGSTVSRTRVRVLN